MNLDQQLRDDLHGAPLPDSLAPPPDLAGTVLRDLRRRRRARALTTAAAFATAVVAAIAVVLPVGWGPLPGGPDAVDPAAGRRSGQVADLPFPAPGGGPQAIHAYTTAGSRTFLLDIAAGQYREYPFEVVLSPDLTRVAVVSDDGRAGVADRVALLRNGESAIQWIDLPPGNGPVWSPDGTALLFTSLDKDAAAREVSFTAHRYDVLTGRVTDTPISVDILGSAVGWAADSRRYVALLPGERSGGTVEPGPLQYIRPDGTRGARVDITGGMVRGATSYSPSRTHLVADASAVMSDGPVASTVVEVATGRVMTELPATAEPVGWYDDGTVATLAGPGGTSLALVDIASGEVTGRVDLSGLPRPASLQLASSAGLTGRAAAYGF